MDSSQNLTQYDLVRRSVVAALCATLLMAMGSTNAQDRDAATNNSDGQVLGRGPIHEAFAGLVPLAPRPGITVPKPVPAPIEEIPPNVKPEGDDVLWVPGYWVWDEDRSDFIWVSGIWRKAPPGTHWIPGYWSQVDDGSQWVPGYWAPQANAVQVGFPAGTTDSGSGINYLPTPPESLENGPSVPASDDNFIWVPGVWIWQYDHYAWRPGYWQEARENWIWNPDQYVYTPAGCAFIRGYWDYPLQQRGMLFAPVYFPQASFAQPGFIYTPTSLINLGLLGSALFGRPAYHHYYFGDYYGSQYSGMGYHPWFALNRFAYNPTYDHSRWYYGRDDSDWNRNLQQTFHERQQQPALRPQQIITSQNNAPAGSPSVNVINNINLVNNISSQLKPGGQIDAKVAGQNLKLERVTLERRQQLVRHVKDVQQVQQQRATLENESRLRTAITHPATTGDGGPTSVRAVPVPTSIKPASPALTVPRQVPRANPPLTANEPRPVGEITTPHFRTETLHSPRNENPHGFGPTNPGGAAEHPHIAPARIQLPVSPVAGPSHINHPSLPSRPIPPPVIHAAPVDLYAPTPHVATPPAPPAPAPAPPLKKKN